jgi:hypothetical protein
MAKAPGERERRIVVGLAKHRMIAGRAATVAG